MSAPESGIDLKFDTIELDWDDYDRLMNDGGHIDLRWKPPRESPPQSVKTLNTTSRTQMKQQLMRQQLQEQEAKERVKEAERQYQGRHFSQHQYQGRNQEQIFGIEGQQFQYHQQHQQQHLPQQQQVPDCSGYQLQQPITISYHNSTLIPSQPLQVQSRLENPTRYHVVQSHKKLLRHQKLCGESDDSMELDIPSAAKSAPLTAAPSSLVIPTESQPTGRQFPCSDPGDRGLGVIRTSSSANNPSVVISNGLVGYSTRRPPIHSGKLGSSGGGKARTSTTAEVADSLYNDHPAKAARFSASSIQDCRRHSTPSSSTANITANSLRTSSSPYLPSGISSAATAGSCTSDASEFDDVIEEVLSLEEGLDNNNVKKCEAAQPILPQSQGDDGSDQIRDLLGLNGYMNNKNSESCPPDVPKVKTEPQSNNDPHVVAFIKDRQKKDNHNMIERRRRFNINDRIKDLSHLLPKNNEPYHEIVRDLRYNKGQILRASVDYIQRLKSDLETSKVADEKRRALEQQNRQLMLRVQELENQLRKHGIAVEETSVDSNLLVPSITHSDVMSPTSTASPATPYTPSATSSPLQPQPAYIPPTTVCNATELPDLNFNCGDSSDIASADTTNHLLNDLVGLIESSDPKKVRCPPPFPGFLLDELLDDFTSGSFGLNLMDDDSLAFSGDPMFSSPQVSSPNSSHHSFDDALTPESMDIVS